MVYQSRILWCLLWNTGFIINSSKHVIPAEIIHNDFNISISKFMMAHPLWLVYVTGIWKPEKFALSIWNPLNIIFLNETMIFFMSFIEVDIWNSRWWVQNSVPEYKVSRFVLHLENITSVRCQVTPFEIIKAIPNIKTWNIFHIIRWYNQKPRSQYFQISLIYIRCI